MDGLLEAPLNAPKRLVCVNFPGFVNNVGRAIEVLGGESKISRVFSNSSYRLEAHLRPKDVESIPLYASRSHCCGMVLKVRRRKTPPPEGSEEQATTVQVVGCVTVKYEFSGLADFQFLPAAVDKNPGASSTFRHATSITEPLSSAALVETDFLHIPTFLFCRSDRPLSFRAYTKPRVDRPVSAQFIPYSEDTVPLAPIKPHEHIFTPIFQQMFEDRPVWSTQAFYNTVQTRVGKRKITRVIIKKINKTLAYMFSSGPWRLCWVKRGYDPRTDPEAYKYQVLDFRSKRSVYRGKPEKVRPQRMLSAIGPTVAKPSTQSCSVALVRKDQGAGDAADDYETHMYQPGTKVNQGQKLFQVCDVMLDDVQDKMMDGRVEACTEKDGWLSTGTMDAMRTVLAQHVQEADLQQNPTEASVS
ncbi:general transcription factor 3C polypeptide 5-like [Sycon ciliatum]|uniref:general transcription factor 3C polypeptide 5-like n=1 Tax=Sycon ciliatum TaxID=27933 RepID=UPI0031F64345